MTAPIALQRKYAATILFVEKPADIAIITLNAQAMNAATTIIARLVVRTQGELSQALSAL